MVKMLAIGSVILLMAGCGSTDSVNTPSTTTTNTTINSGGGDVAINNVDVSNEGMYIQNADGTVTYTTTSGDNSPTGNNNDGGEKKPYDSSWDEATCTTNGYFFCTLNGLCLNQPTASGSCTVAARTTINITTF